MESRVNPGYFYLTLEEDNVSIATRRMMAELHLPKRIGSYLLLQNIGDVEWADLYLAVKGNSELIQDYVIVALIKEWFDDDIISSLNLISNQLKQAEEMLLWQPLEFYYEAPNGLVVFPLFNAFSLSDVLKKAAAEGVPLTIDLVLLIYSNILEAMNMLHEIRFEEKRIIHGMVTPSHIFISAEGEVKLMHSGIFQSMIMKNKFCGLLKENLSSYLAPEQSGKLIGSRRTDIYTAALGLLEVLINKPLKEILTGSIEKVINSMNAYSPNSELVDLPQEVKEVLKRALSPDPDARYDNCDEMRKELDEFLFAGEFQPSTFNLAFYMNGLFKEESEAFKKMIEETKSMDLVSYFQIVPDESELADVAELIKEEEEVIELDETVSDKESIPAEPVSTVARPPLFKTTEAPPKKAFMIPLLIVLFAVIIGGGITGYYFWNQSKIKSQAQNTVAQPPPVQVAQNTAVDKQKKEEMEKVKQENLALKKQIEDLMNQRNQSQSEADKKKAEEKIKQAKEKLEQNLSKELQTASDQNKTALTKENTPEKESNPPADKPKENKSSETTPIKEPETKTTTNNPNATISSVDSTKTISNPGSGGESTSGKSEIETPADNKNSSKSATIQPPARTVPEIYTDAELDEPLRVIKDIKPDYPLMARKQKIGGIVIISVTVNREGRIENPVVLKGVSVLNQSALDAAKSTVFSRPKKNGSLVKATRTMVFNFKP